MACEKWTLRGKKGDRKWWDDYSHGINESGRGRNESKALAGTSG